MTAPTALRARWRSRVLRHPGESTSLSPPLRISRGSSTSAETMRRSLPGFPCSDTYSGSSSSETCRRSRAEPGVCAASSLRVRIHADASSAYPTEVGTLVAMSSSTGHAGAFTRALMSLLLPCLNSPTTMTRTSGSSSRARVCSSRFARSARPVSAANALSPRTRLVMSDASEPPPSAAAGFTPASRGTSAIAWEPAFVTPGAVSGPDVVVCSRSTTANSSVLPVSGTCSSVPS